MGATLKALLLTAFFATLPNALDFAAKTPIYPTTATVVEADPVERWVFCTGIKPEMFHFSYRTVYKISGKVVEPGDWWRAVKKGKVLQVKAVKRAGFWFVSAANLEEK